MYTGNSVVDYLNTTGQKSDFATRASLAASKGITGYTGSAQQNTQLLNILRGGGGTTPAPAAVAPPAVTPTAQPSSTPASGSPTATGQPTSAQDLVNQGFYGYQGWDNAQALADFKATGGSGKGGNAPTASGSGIAGGFLNSPTINLPEIYQTLFDQSGVSGLEKQLSDQTKSFTDAQSKINDNPFLSEATRVGRLSKLQTDFNNNTAGTRNDIATKKADIETKLNIQTKQFDINSQQATQALSQFQTLLSSGALSNASGEDIAAITRATGMSSTMINAAIKSAKDKSVQTSTINFDDGTNQGFAIINSQTGEIIKKENVAASKPTKGSGSSDTVMSAADIKTTKANVTNDAKKGALLQDLVEHYARSGGLSTADVYNIYKDNSIYGKPVETLDQVLQGKYSTQAGN